MSISSSKILNEIDGKAKENCIIYSTRQIFSVIKKKAKKKFIQGCLVWFYPYDSKIIHVSVSKKIANAVGRNKIRRILKNTLRINEVPIGIYIISPKKQCDYKNLYKIINRAFS